MSAIPRREPQLSPTEESQASFQSKKEQVSLVSYIHQAICRPEGTSDPIPLICGCVPLSHGVLALSVYFIAAIGLTLFNKWFYSPVFNRWGFHFPLTVTCIHQFIVSIVILRTHSWFSKTAAGVVQRDMKLLLPLGTVGILCGLDWGLSNLSLRYIPLTLYEMTKSSTPMYTLLIGVCIGLNVLSLRLGVIILFISLGMFLAISGGDVHVLRQSDFPVKGFACVVIATFLSSARTVSAQYFLQRLRLPQLDEKEHDHPDGTVGVNAITGLYYATPASFFALIIPALAIEGREVITWFSTASPSQFFFVTFFISCSSILAITLSGTELVVAKKTSALTLCVVGTSKQLILILLAMIIFGEKVGFLNILGFTIAIAGVSLYNYDKYLIMRRQHEEAETEEELDMRHDASGPETTS